MFNWKALFSKQKTDPSIPMIPEAYSSGSKASYELSMYSTKQIRWVSKQRKENGEPVSVRIPHESSREFSYPGNFTAGGKAYQSWEQLCEAEAGTSGLYQDIYKRYVFYTSELFPCFDSYDYLYENRRYRWFFILGDGKLTRVFYTDEQKHIHVTEDVANVENKCWEALQKLSFWADSFSEGQRR